MAGVWTLANVAHVRTRGHTELGVAVHRKHIHRGNLHQVGRRNRE